MKTSTAVICVVVIASTCALINGSDAWPFGDTAEKVDKLSTKVSNMQVNLIQLVAAVKQNAQDIEALKTGGLVTNSRVNQLRNIEDLQKQVLDEVAKNW